MQHSTLIRIIDLDGMCYVGGYDSFKSNHWRVYLLGHTRFFYRRQIVDMFEMKNNVWCRVSGTPYVYDFYLDAGGNAWPEEFENLWSEEINHLKLDSIELHALLYAKSKSENGSI